MRRTKSTRHAAVLVLVIVCLTVVTGILASASSFALRSHRESRNERHVLQAQLLCDAGVRLALAKLSTDANYSGETWSPDLTGVSIESAAVTIGITTDQASAKRTLSVTANIKTNSTSTPTIQRTRTLTIKSSQASNSEKSQ